MDADLLRRGIDAYDGVQAAVGHPRRAVRADNHSMRPRPLAELDATDLTGLGIQQAQLAQAPGDIPDAALRSRRTL